VLQRHGTVCRDGRVIDVARRTVIGIHDAALPEPDSFDPAPEVMIDWGG